MLKTTKVLTIINYILSGITWLLILLMASSIIGVNFGTVIIAMLCIKCSGIFEIITFVFSLVSRAEEKGRKYLIANSVAIVVMVVMCLIFLST